MMNNEIKLFNSLTNKVEVFKPIEEGKVKIYVCGPTVYDYPHIGNCRPPVVFDLLRRLFKYHGYEVTFVSNFTDVDDKIINKAIEQNKTEKEITEFFIDKYKGILSDLNVTPAAFNPRVTENMDAIIDYINNLIKNDYAYNVDGEVFFRVGKIPNYGQLSNISLDDLRAGARIEENSAKESPFDFVLWKTTSKGIKWNSPFGEGRPGWHTECCVMINNIMGETIDIHGGGFDLKFPHHENEIAQNYATCQKPLANYWMHNGFVNINNEKMSKSLGNVIKGNDFIDQYGPLLSRYVLLSTYYRAPLNISEETINTAKIELSKIEAILNALNKYVQINHIDVKNAGSADFSEFINALSDDLNISNAMAEVFKVVKEANQLIRTKDVDKNQIAKTFNTLLEMMDVLGLKFDLVQLDAEAIELLSKYEEARRNKDFETSDKLRALLIEKKLL